MIKRRHLVGGCTVLASVIFSVLSFAQVAPPTGPGDFKIKSIRQQLVDAPDFKTSTADIGARGPTLGRRWLRIETQFDSSPEWADDVALKYFVLIGKGREAKLFTGDVTHINVAKGTHFSAMFMHPNVVKRFGAGQVEAVAVQLYHQGRLLGQDSDPPARQRWWEAYTPVAGFLLSPEKSPWSTIAHERYDAIKSTP